MTKQPPVPTGNQSPFPIEEPPHDHAPEAASRDDAGEGEAITAAKRISAAKERWKPDAQQLGLGAAIGVGSAAIVAGLLYWRGGKK